MSAVISTRIITPEDLLLMPDDSQGFELVDDRLVEKNMGGFASFQNAELMRLLREKGVLAA